MSFSFLVLGIALVIRLVLDIGGLFKSNEKLDILYALLFCILGLVILFENPKDIFGVFSIIISIFYVSSFYKKNSARNEQK